MTDEQAPGAPIGARPGPVTPAPSETIAETGLAEPEAAVGGTPAGPTTASTDPTDPTDPATPSDPDPDPDPDPAVATAPATPAATDPAAPVATDPATPVATDPATPAAADPVTSDEDALDVPEAGVGGTPTAPVTALPDPMPAVATPGPGPTPTPPVPVRPRPAPAGPTPAAGTPAVGTSAAGTPGPPPAVPETPAVEAAPTDTGAIPPVPSAAADPGRWGRVDDEGTVWLRATGPDTDPAGERAVGSWQAGDGTEGLAHFARRFDDLRTEAELLVTRLGSGRGDARATLRSAATLRERLADAAVVGDVAALGARLDAITAAAEQASVEEKAAKAGARDEAVARKEALIAEADGLAEETTRWKHAGDRFAAMLDEWKTIKGIERKTDDALWKRFARARETFTRRRGAHFAELDRARTVARTRKEELVVEAEGLAGSTEWGPTAGRYKDLMVEWKAAGRTSKEADDALWARFRGAQDAFFARRSATFDARDAEFVENARAKEALLAEAGRIELSDTDAARAALRDLQERWDTVGKVPRERVKEFSTRLQEVEDRVRAAVDKRWQQGNPETEARVAQFRARVDQYEAQAQKAHAAGDRRRAQEAERQAAQWREWLATAEQANG